MKKISIMTACYNEEENVLELIKRVRAVFENSLKNYDYEHIFIDNASEDNTLKLLKAEAVGDKRIKIIVNSRNFGHVRSPSFALLECKGDAVISLVADLQDPPEMIQEFIQEWEKGADIVAAIKKDSKEQGWMFKLRETYYHVLSKLSDVNILKNFTGFGLFDKKVIEALREMNDPYPFFRGMLAEAGFNVSKVLYSQPIRLRGVTKNNFYSLYDMAMLGIIANSKIPLRLSIFIGVISSILSLLVGFVYFIIKILYWDVFDLGVAPILISLSFMFSVLLFFLGIIGEYIGAIYTQVQNRPLVFIKEKVNFKE